METAFIQILNSILYKVQRLNGSNINASKLRALINEAGETVTKFNTLIGIKLLQYRDDLNLYLDGGEDGLNKFYFSKAGALTLITEQLRVLDTGSSVVR
jgi:hypothetical protein